MRETMTDEQMVNELRLALLDAAAPTPSVETLLHAALPGKFIDHTHRQTRFSPSSIRTTRALAARPSSATSLLFIPYTVMRLASGLARACKVAWDSAAKEGRAPTVMVLERHGVFTFGETAKESYTRMIEAVTKCEDRAPLVSAGTTAGSKSLSEEDVVRTIVAIRGALAKDEIERGPDIVSFAHVAGDLEFSSRVPNASELTPRVGALTPADHASFRTKPWPPIVRSASEDPVPAIKHVMLIKATMPILDEATTRKGIRKKRLDPWPRIVLVPGVGILGVGKTKKDAEIACDVYEHTLEVIARAENVGSYAPVGLDDLFDVEYWSLEQAKIKKETELPLARSVALITGAAAGIGRATAALFIELGAHVVLCDRDDSGFADLPKKSLLTTSQCDVTKEADVQAAFHLAAKTFGGVDIVVSNAGMAAEGRLDTKEGDAVLRASLDVNLLAHVHVARIASTLMKLQGRGGSLLFNASKSAFNQGPGFGPYAVAKAALVSLMRQYAVDLAGFGIRSNAVNADRIRTNIFLKAEPGAPPLVELRAKARGITVDEYFRSNLLPICEVLARDVAEALARPARARATTGCVVTADGGNAAAFPR